MALGANRKASDQSGGVRKVFYEDAKVSVYMGSRYGKHTDSFIRINIATSRSYLQEALERIRAQYYKIAPNNKK